MHDHAPGHDHEHDPMDDALQPPADVLLAQLQPELARLLEEVIAMRATIAFQNEVIAALQGQLREASK